ncbi:cupin domain-containing protein [Nitrogeniibacter mangrovi]|uniref:Cupin domain-containing protein n=1 Tax=Nitrogeniibacter mangrovi TaxID=2016596 RepID=A0A6C1BAC4_9RHOO|nr:cupin domain-containing protein [Nitrogeniibacter mangrovi]QID19330.1 cupin domain-containing protein [Nitrogeniibacter mangrovi]
MGDEYFFEEGCFITELLNTEADPLVSVARARVPVGVTTRWHVLDGIVERYLIEQGEGVVEVGTQPPQPVGAGDTVHIAPGLRQRIRNAGATDLVFLAVCTPRFVPAAYRDAE